MTNEQFSVQNFGWLAPFGGRCLGCKKWITAQTPKEWQRATKSPCPHCGRKGW